MSYLESLYPTRLNLAHTPTPLQPLRRFGEKLGLELYVKRDDLTGAELSGNKVRKLEFVMAEALEQGADTVLTCGGAQSNHCRATAVAAAKLGLHCRLILRTGDPASPPPLEANSLLDRLAGAEIVWISPAEYRNRAEVFPREAEAVKRAGGRPYIIPEGASNALGAWGYIRAMDELAADLAASGGPSNEPATILYAAGSGGTGAGLILGQKLLGIKGRLVGINVCDDREYFVKAIGEICEQAIARFHLDVSFDRERDVEIIDGYVGRGYAESRPEELELIRDVARTEGLFLDPVYTGKAFFGMTRELQRDPGRFGRRVVFLHTGGLFGLFPKTAELVQLL
ncbi:MAG: D-cysteine desulfhydrase family protein [Thermodesulfobacteriota bacterium]